MTATNTFEERIVAEARERWTGDEDEILGADSRDARGAGPLRARIVGTGTGEAKADDVECGAEERCVDRCR